MAFTYRETQIVKGMLARGDKQSDIAAWFGVNGGRIAEVSTGKSDYASAPAYPPEKLPSPGPYIDLKAVAEIRTTIDETINLIKGAGKTSDETKLAIECLEECLKKIST